MKEKIKKYYSLIIKIIIIVLVLIIFALIGYFIRQNIPMFVVNDIFVKCSVDGKDVNDVLTASWNLSLSQINDVYINFGHIANPYTFDSNKKYLKSFSVENVKVMQNPKIGRNIEMYYINSNNERIEFKDSIVYNIVSSIDNTTENQISIKGGQIALSFVNDDFIRYVYNNVNELTFDGTLLKPTGILKSDIQFTVSLDIVFETMSEDKYTYNILLQLPYGNFIEDGQYIGDYPFMINLQK